MPAPGPLAALLWLCFALIAVPHSVAAAAEALGTRVAAAEDTEPESALRARFLSLQEAGRLDEAAALGERGLARAERTHGRESTEARWWHFWLGALRLDQRDYDRAERHLARALAIEEKLRGRDHFDNNTTMGLLALVYTRQGRAPEAEAMLKRIVAIYERKYGPDHPETAEALQMLATSYKLLGRYDDSLKTYERIVRIRENHFGANSKKLGQTLYDMANVYNHAERWVEGEPVCRRALAILERTLSQNEPLLADAYQLQGFFLEQLGRFAQAEPMYKKALAIKENNRAAPQSIALTLGRLAVLYQQQRRFAEAEPLAKRALALNEQAYGPDSHEHAWILITIGAIQQAQGRYADAEAALQRALALTQKKFGAESRQASEPLNSLATLYVQQGRLPEAEAAFKRALTIRRAQLGPEHYDVAETLANLGTLYLMQDRFDEVEPLLRQALAIYERALGPEHPDTATTLENLGTMFLGQGRAEEAEPLLRRGIAIREKALGPDNETIATTLINLAAASGPARAAEAEQLLRRALAITERARGPAHPDTAAPLRILATHLANRGRYREAEPLLLRAQAILETSFGADHLELAYVLSDLARAHSGSNRLADAEAALNRALAIFRTALPANHRDIAQTQYLRSTVLLSRGKLTDAYAAARDATAILAERRTLSTAARWRGDWREDRRSDWVFAQELRAAHALARSQPAGERALREASFETAQFADFDDTGQAIAQMAARFAAGSGPLSALLREQQSLLQRQLVLNRLLADAMGSSEAGVRAHGQAFRTEIEGIAARLKQIDAILRRDHKAYIDLVDPRPLSVVEMQSLLSEDEAAVSIVAGDHETYLFAVSKSQASWARSTLDEQQLTTLVTALRRQLDPDQWQGAFASFDRALSHRLYRELWAPLEGVLAGKTNVFVVTTGPLTSLPLSVLVTEAPAGGMEGDANPQAFRDTAWLAKRHALTTLPAISSLKALRLYASKGSASEPFAGFGDPALGAAQAATRTRSVASVFRGATPDVNELRTLSPLPGTASELRALAKALGASDADVFLRERATEAQLKAANLTKKRVIAFATHALTAGDLGLGEPGLVFTPPASASERDDGYLAASEAARLDLRADWIILSACNTAAGDAPGAKGLSGLARAFFLAGARSLLVSHWPVWDDAAGRITTTAVKSFQANPAQGRAEALRQAALALMADTSSPRFAHPAAWAPFVLVGEQRAN